MATIYYVTATAPATIYVTGKYAQLAPGQSHGPFTKEEIDLVMRSPDRRRLMVTSQESAEPIVVSPVEGVEAYARPKDSVDATFTNVEKESAQESVRVTSSDVPEPLTAQAEEAQQMITSDPKAADWHKVEAEEETTSSMEALPDASDVSKEEVKPRRGRRKTV